MRGLYTHASDRMRNDLKHALQARTTHPAGAPGETPRHQPSPGDREEMISRTPPSRSEAPMRPRLGIRGEPELTASDLAIYQKLESGAKGTRTLTSCLQSRAGPPADHAEC